MLDYGLSGGNRTPSVARKPNGRRQLKDLSGRVALLSASSRSPSWPPSPLALLKSFCRRIFRPPLGFRVLIVDSDLGVCSSLSRTLAGLGFALDVAYDAEEARNLVQQHRYSVGLFGESLSDADGVTLFRDLSAQHPGMLGVLLTPVTNLPTVARAVGAGMSRVAHIPLDYRDLVQFLTTLPAGSSETAPTVKPRPSADGSQTFSEEVIAELTPGDIAQRCRSAT
ncbi:MAG: response regulator [Planctomycetaceae bacterium]